MASKEPKTPKPSKSSKEAGLKVMSSSCGCTYLGDGNQIGGVFIPPGIDSKKQTSHCGKMGGSSGNCDFL
jgi:hypothetical protein